MDLREFQHALLLAETNGYAHSLRDFCLAQLFLFLLGVVVGASVAYFPRAWKAKSPTKIAAENRQSGNMILMLFSAVAMAGLIGTGYMTIVKGPGKGLSSVSKQNQAENAMLAATALVVKGGTEEQDCDGDGVVEPAPYRVSATGPVGGGVLPLDTGASKLDPWGKDYGYCVWDHGNKTTTDNVATCGGTAAKRLKGGDISTEYVLAIISAGPDGIFQTKCNDWADADDDKKPDTPLLVTTPTTSDDLMRPATMQSLVASGTAQLQTQPDAACTPGSEGLTRFDMGVMQICTPGGWKEVGAAVEGNNFIDQMNINPGIEVTSNTISFSGFFGTHTATVDNGAHIWVNDQDKGSSTSIIAGNSVYLKGNASVVSGELKKFTLKIGAISRIWNVKTATSCTLDGVTVAPNVSYTFYSAVSGSDCASIDQIRTCANGAFGGTTTYKYASCSSVGQQVFTASGSFVVPVGVTSISAVVVGAGGTGVSGGKKNGSSGGTGGALRYATALSVTPGETLTIGIGVSNSTATTIKRNATVLLSAASGGSAGTTTAIAGASSVIGGNIGGGDGGSSTTGVSMGDSAISASGGGAGGYSGTGGAGGISNGAAGSGGGGGSGGSYNNVAGGGVGLLGAGSNGAAGGGGGSGGASATTTGIGGAYGGGGGKGGPGAVRVIWGAGRAYPSTGTANQ